MLDTWPQLSTTVAAQDGQELYRATARPAVLLASAHTLAAFDIDPGTYATVSTEAGSVTLRPRSPTFPTASSGRPPTPAAPHCTPPSAPDSVTG